MPSKYVHLSSEDVPFLAAGHTLVLNPDERILTEITEGIVCAQCRFSRNAFRLLFLLLLAPQGADYAELLACLRCPDAVFRKVVQTSSLLQALEILSPHIERWNKHLERVAARQGKEALEKELKMVRRAAKERRGANTLLRRNGFALSVRPLYRKGYLLARGIVQKPPRTMVGAGGLEGRRDR